MDLAHLDRGEVATGRAFVWLTPDGENSIVVLPLANRAMTADRVIHALDRLRPTVVLSQLEIPTAVTEAVAAWCSKTGTRFMLNASPVRPLPTDVLAAADPILFKDLGCVVAGEATSFGIGPLRDVAWPITSFLAEQFLAAGFIVLGHTNAPELGTAVTTEARSFPSGPQSVGSLPVNRWFIRWIGPPPSPAAWCRWHTPTTEAARSAFPLASADWSGSSPHGPASARARSG